MSDRVEITHERDVIAERLTEIKVERESIGDKPTPAQARLVEELDREETELLRQLAEHDPR
jgi:hypothetical protein